MTKKPLNKIRYPTHGSVGIYGKNNFGLSLINMTIRGFDTGIVEENSIGSKSRNLRISDCQTSIRLINCWDSDHSDMFITYSHHEYKRQYSKESTIVITKEVMEKIKSLKT